MIVWWSGVAIKLCSLPTIVAFRSFLNINISSKSQSWVFPLEIFYVSYVELLCVFSYATRTEEAREVRRGQLWLRAPSGPRDARDLQLAGLSVSLRVESGFDSSQLFSSQRNKDGVGITSAIFQTLVRPNKRRICTGSSTFECHLRL